MSWKPVPRGGTSALALVVALAGCERVAHTADGPGPGDGGAPALPAGTSELWLTDAVADAAGRVVAVGAVGDAGATDFAVLRFSADGAGDPMFGAAGLVTIELGSAVDQAYAVAVDAQDRIVVVGESSRDGTPDVAIVRLLADGTLDPSFGTAGVQVLALSTWKPKIDRATAVALDAAGNLLIAAVVDRDQLAREDFAVVRLLEDGTPDPSFGSNGTAVIPRNSDDYPAFVRATADGRVVVGGSSNASVSLARLDAAGVLDPTFGTSGIVDTSFGRAFQRIADATEDAQGRWVLVGDAVLASASGGRSDVLVARYLADGALDTTFGGGTGAQIVTTGGDAMGRAVVVEPDGHIVIAGQAHDGRRWATLLARLADDGTPDAAFATDGWRTHGFATGSHEVAALIATPGGLSLAGTADGAPLLASLGEAAAPTLGTIEVPTTLPFDPVAAGDAPDRPLVDGLIFTSTAAAPFTGDVLTVTGNVGPLRGTPTAVFLRANEVRFSEGATVFADGQAGQAPLGPVPGAGGEGGSGGGSGAAGHSGHAGVGGSFGRDGGSASGGAGGRGWASQYTAGRYWGLGGAGGTGNGCCPPIVPAGRGSNGAGGGGGGSWTNIFTPGGGGGGGLVVIVADRITGPGVVRARGGDGRFDTNGGYSGGGGGGVVWIAARAYDGQLQADVSGGTSNVKEPGRPGTARIFQILEDGRLRERTFAEAW